MAERMQIGYRVVGTIKEVKGSCSAGHRVGDRIELSGHSSGGLCGFFYHDIFPYLNTMQFGGKYPWWDQDVLELECPDRYNTVSIRLERKK